MNFLFRRSSLLAATSLSNRALAASILSSDPLHTLPALSSQPLSPIAAGAIHTSPERPRSTSLLRRDLHFSTRPLGFQATDASHAQSAVADFYDEDRPPATGSQKGADEGLEIAKLGIANEIVGQLAVKGITKLFPIQRAVLEPAMQGRDMIGRAKTGTGKTLAFGIPIMDKILRFNKEHGRGRCPLALILAPTRELARQVEKEFRESAPLDTVCVYGGTPIQQQMRTLNYGVDVVVGTPGRVIDLLNRGALVLSEVQFIVLDEADQMLAVGFADDVESILEKLPLQRQSMMFSATMPPWIRSLTQKHLKNPLTIDLVGENDQKLAEGISLYSIASERYAKPSILAALIKEHAKGGKCIVFTQTKRDADQLSYTMGRSLNCQPLHGDISQQQRERTLSSFRDGGFNILIATDVAARGLDIPNVDLVIHYELPNSSEIFVHRSGRTGRAGKKGSAIVIYSQEQYRLVRGIEQDTGCKFTELPKIVVESGGEGLFGGMGGGFNSYSGGGRMGGQGFGRGGGGGGYGSGSSYGRPTQSYGGGVGGYGGGASYGRPTQSYGGGIGGYGGGSSYGRPTQSYGGGGFGSPSHGQFGSQGGPGAAGGSYGSSGFGRPHQSNGGGGGFGTPSAGRAGGYGEFGHDQFGSQGRPGSAGGSYGGSGFGIPHQSNGGGFGSPSSGRAGGYGESGHGQFGSTGGPGSSGGSYGGQSPGGFGDSGRRESTDNSWPGRSSMSSS